MGKVTYLLGAGASIEAIPAVEKTKDGLLEIRAFLQTPNVGEIRNEEKIINSSITYTSVIAELINDLEWLANACDAHASIDTFAKKLFISGEDDELKRLKATLTAYFTLIQIKGGADKRYDAFFASILNKEIKFPIGLNIISWNYDNQLEKAFGGFRRTNSIDTIKNILNINHKNDQVIYLN